MIALTQAEEVLQRVYGYPSFRKGQKEILERILQKQDVLGILPTGGGKSLCYQIPALLWEGVTLVISPLISLMKDQVDACNQLGIPASFLNSTLTWSKQVKIIQQLREGKIKLLYIAPERLESDHFLELLKSISISLLTVDEAHCISQWGHDFRPSYLKISRLLELLPKRPTVAALTATATKQVRDDILKYLQIPSDHVEITSFRRDNLSFSVLHGIERRSYLLRYLQEHPNQSGIIYCATRKDVESVYEFLREKNFSVGKYHAGLSDEERSITQEKFSYDQIQVIIATNAFGMGIDKSNVRFVLHYQMPRNLENYYQEAGRAGRDGEESECILLYHPQDIFTHTYLIEHSELSTERKKLELQKLMAMKNYAHTQGCFTEQILSYFGEKSEQPCGKCGNCLRVSQTTKKDITITAQKIFSCIRRMKERFGLNMVSRVLVGSKAKRVTELGFEKLSTYGILRDLTKKEVLQLCKQLAGDGYIQLVPNANGFLIARLTSKAWKVLRGELSVFQYQPIENSQKSSAITLREQLFERLRKLRLAISAREKVPPFVIVSDSTLNEMTRFLPTDRAQMLQIKGMGETKVERFGEEFIQEILSFLEEHPLEPIRETHIEEKQKKVPPSHLLTYKMYQAGKTLSEIAAARNLTISTIQDHLFRADSEGHFVCWDDFLPSQRFEMIARVAEKMEVTKLRTLKEALPEEISYFEIKAYFAKLAQKQNLLKNK